VSGLAALGVPDRRAKSPSTFSQNSLFAGSSPARSSNDFEVAGGRAATRRVITPVDGMAMASKNLQAFSMSRGFASGQGCA
jgi:hypothetical protein